MLILLFQIHVLFQVSNIVSSNLTEIEDRILKPDICFAPSAETIGLAEDQVISCILAMPGHFPPLRSRYMKKTNRCCFRGEIENGIFWAVGESVMSEIISTEIPGKNGDIPKRPMHSNFDLKSAQLLDIRVLDATTDEVIPDARISFSNDAVHLVSYTKMTDSDGYAVFPAIPGSLWVATVRADGYLTPPPLYFSSLGLENEERVVELDPGISLSGKVVDMQGNPVSYARLHVEVDRPNQLSWNSEIDLPRPITSLADGKGWDPGRGSWSTAENGHFLLNTIPRGQIRVYASHEQYAPSEWMSLDASDNDDLKPVEIALQKPHQAWVRVENSVQTAVVSHLTVYDDVTGCEIASITTPASGSAEIKNLPSKARFFVTSDSFAPVQITREIRDQDEITIVLDQKRTDIAEFHVQDENGVDIHNATISPASPSVRKKHPTCLGKTDSSGSFSAEFCPQSFWADVYHPEYAHILEYVSTEKPSQFVLKPGKALDVEMVDEKTRNRLSQVSCTVETTFHSGAESQTLRENFDAADGHLVLSHRPESVQKLSCTWNGEQIQIESLPEKFPKSLTYPHFETRQTIVIDHFGSPVPYARLEINGRILETDDAGKIEIQAKPGSTIRYYHWQHGSGISTFAEGHSELELRLPDVPDQDVIECLNAHGVAHVIDSAQILLDLSDSRLNIERGDAVEACSSVKFSIVRNGRRMDIRWK